MCVHVRVRVRVRVRVQMQVRVQAVITIQKKMSCVKNNLKTGKVL